MLNKNEANRRAYVSFKDADATYLQPNITMQRCEPSINQRANNIMVKSVGSEARLSELDSRLLLLCYLKPVISLSVSGSLILN